jgi:transposase
MVLEEGIEAKDVASRLGIDLMALRRWTNKEQQTKSSKDQESMKDLLQVNRKLEEENKRLKMEREILKKAMAYLVPSQS